MRHTLVPIIALATTACGSIMGGGPLRIDSAPDEAAVVLESDTLGTTPTTVTPPDGATLSIEREQHHPDRLLVERSFNAWTLGNGLIAVDGLVSILNPERSRGDIIRGIGGVAIGILGVIYDYRSDAVWMYEPERLTVDLDLDREAVYAGRDWPEEIKRAVIARRVVTGMTPEQVRAAWGEPKSTNTNRVAGVRNEHWTYDIGRNVYLEDGIVTAVQDCCRP